LIKKQTKSNEYTMPVRNHITALCGGLLLLTLQACHTTKKVAATNDKPVVTTPDEKLKAEDFLDRTLTWTTFSGKADTHFEKKDKSQDVTCNLRMNKDKDIWASVVALGILEAARVKITPDTLQAINKIDKSGYSLSYKEGQELIQTQVDFPVLQNLFIGNPLISGVAVSRFDVKDSTVSIVQEKDDFQQTLTYNKASGTLQELQLTSEKKDFSCDIRYEKYGAITMKQPFAFNRYMVIKNKGEEIKLNMEFSKAELDAPVETNFTIPSSYDIKKITDKKQ